MSAQFLLVDDGAAQRIVQATMFQSIEFSAGEQLAELVRSERQDLDLPTSFSIVHANDGVYLLDPTESQHYIVVDFRVTDPFSGNRATALFILQRVLRFAIRHWTDARPSPSDRRVQNSSKYAVFPFSIGQRTQYRLSVETSPDPKRVAKRFGGKNLLVYQDGCDAGSGPEFQPDIKIFRRAFDGLPDALRDVRARKSTADMALNTGPLLICKLSKRDANPVSPLVGFDKWMSLLTTSQLTFVKRLPRGAERIEGPAGTGKTLSLVLKCIHALKANIEQNSVFHAAFFAHSEATRSTIEAIFDANFPDLHAYTEAHANRHQRLTITTLQMWCAQRLGRETISESQFLDPDALTAKEYRRIIIQDCYVDVMEKDYITHKPFLSEDFRKFLENEEKEVIADIIQHEVAVMIKGRAGENIDVYRDLPPITYALPCRTSADRSFIFVIYQRYAKILAASGEYDTDDVVLTALSSLENPIWRRKRFAEGFDALFVDETHLFNLNELSVFHHLTRAPDKNPISFSIDQSQAPGDRGLTKALIEETISGQQTDTNCSDLKSVFRSSSEIIALAASVTASGAKLFLGFENPLGEASAIATVEDENLASIPVIRRLPSDEIVCAEALNRAGALASEIGCSHSEILIVPFSKDLLELLRRTSENRNKAIEIIERRGDLRQVQKATKHARYVVALPEFVSGLEFHAAILLGVDEGRVPPTPVNAGQQSRHFLAFRSHNHLYVAITRARYRVEILTNSARGPSYLLEAALRDGLLQEAEPT